jgi:hypothetical protein
MLLDRDPSEQEADMSVRHTADKHAVRLESTPAPDCRAVANERISELMPPISDLASKHELVEKLSDRTILLTADKAGRRGIRLQDAHLDGVVPAELYKEEQTQLSARMAAVEGRVEMMARDSESVDGMLSAIGALLRNCYDTYIRAPKQIKRRLNQTYFERIFVDDEGPDRVELAEPFATLSEMTEATSESRERSVLQRVLANETTPDHVDWVKGCSDEHLVPLEGLEPPTVSLGRNCSSIELQRLAYRA